MPLPDSSVPWPPKDTERPRILMDEWGAWYSGDPDRLETVYGAGHPGPDPKAHPWQYSGGLRGRIGRMWWGRPTSANQSPTRLHVPIAGDIAAVNADLLFGEPPSIQVENEGDKVTQDRLDEILANGMHAALLEGGELCSPYGGVYMRASWNTAVSDMPIVEPILPDCAAPEWVGQHLVAVTFWRVLSDDKDQYLRHLERHEPGMVYHGLYQGTEDKLGRKLPLADHPATAGFAKHVSSQGGIRTGATRLAVEFVPNMRPHRIIRGTPLGRSDYSGVEPLMDSLDEAYSSWMRDIRLAKARLHVPEAWMQSMGRGQAGVFDPEQEVYVALRMLQGTNDSAKDMLSPTQFAIRVTEHAETCSALAEQIVRGAGYSAQTFGESGDLAVTATEVHTRERRTYSTRARKIGYWQPALARLMETVLEMDAHAFKTKVTPQRPRIEWPDGVQDAPLAIAETLNYLSQASAASTEVRVAMLHPDWNKEQVAAEVRLIKEENPPIDVQAAAGLVGGGAPDVPPGQEPDAPSRPGGDDE